MTGEGCPPKILRDTLYSGVFLLPYTWLGRGSFSGEDLSSEIGNTKMEVFLMYLHCEVFRNVDKQFAMKTTNITA